MKKKEKPMFKPLAFGTLESDLDLYINICSKINIEGFSPDNKEYFTFDELVSKSGFTKEELNEKAFSFYVGMEEDDWDPCKELCSLCAVMKYKYGKIWYIYEQNWNDETN